MEQLHHDYPTDTPELNRWPLNLAVQLIAEDANRRLDTGLPSAKPMNQQEIDARQPNNEIDEAQRQIDCNFAINASRFAYENADAIQTVPRSLRQNAADTIVPEAELEKRVPHDKLTGLPSQNAFLDVIQAADTRKETAVIVFDLNHFKQLNDTLGHPAGDSILRVIGGLVASSIKNYKGTTGYRLGGDEFAVIVNSIHATNLLEDLETKVTELVQGIEPVTSDIGDDIDPSDLRGLKLALAGGIGNTYEAADKAMYARKATETVVS